MVIRILVTLALIALILALNTVIAHAEGEEECNNWERITSIVLSESTRQPLEAQVEVARVAVTKGACFIDENFYAGWRVAQYILRTDPRNCIVNLHCRVYHLLNTVDPAVRESAALAAHIALEESPRVPRYHVDNWQSEASWWDSPRACPAGWFIIAELKVC